MSELPRVIDDRGAFVPLTRDAEAALNEGRATRYERLKSAASKANGISAALFELSEKMKITAEAIRTQREMIERTLPPITFKQLWDETFKR
jgi:hypothetical protein